MTIKKEKARRKAEQIKDILKRKFNQEAQVDERSDGGSRKYYKVTCSTLGSGTFAAVDMKGHLTINKDRKHIVYDCHLEKLKKNGFEIERDSHNDYVQWDTSNLEEFVKLRFECYTQSM